MNRTNRTELRRLPNRGSHEWTAIYDILDAGFLAHVGFQVNDQPVVIPTLYGRAGEKLYLHGSAASRMLGELEKGMLAEFPRRQPSSSASLIQTPCARLPPQRGYNARSS